MMDPHVKLVVNTDQNYKPTMKHECCKNIISHWHTACIKKVSFMISLKSNNYSDTRIQLASFVELDPSLVWASSLWIRIHFQ